MKRSFLFALLLLGALVNSRAGHVLTAAIEGDRVVIQAGGKPFTEYLSSPTNKYPFFYPVLGPRTGKPVTTRGETNFPHHSSIFFGCDRVNGGNYWQEGLNRGRIVSKSVKLVRETGTEIVIEQECDWERPDAPSPFHDRRRIAVTAPTDDLRVIDFDVTLVAKNKVRIEKTNHSLFAVRVRPELSVLGGGRLVNANGDEGEKGTFGKKAAWADYFGRRDGVVEGVALLVDPHNRWSPSPWFTRDYGFMSPTPFNWPEKDGLEFQQGETLHLRYRVIVHAGELSREQINRMMAVFEK